MTEYIANSAEVGRRPRISLIRAYSSALRPSSANGWSTSGFAVANSTVSLTFFEVAGTSWDSSARADSEFAEMRFSDMSSGWPFPTTRSSPSILSGQGNAARPRPWDSPPRRGRGNRLGEGDRAPPRRTNCPQIRLGAMATPKIVLFYVFTPLPDPEAVRLWQDTLAQSLGLKGRVIVSKDGINATLGGDIDEVKAYVRATKSYEPFRKADIKWSNGQGDDFPRLSVKVRPELVTFGTTDEITVTTDGVQGGGVHLGPGAAAQAPRRTRR